MTISKIFSLSLLVAASMSAFASGSGSVAASAVSANSFDALYLQIADVKIEDVSQSLAPEAPAKNALESLGRMGPRRMDKIDELEIKLDQIINMGKKIWAIVEAGKPVVNTSWNSASAIPSGVTSWDQMGSWRAPVSRAYRISATNLYGVNVIDFTYRLTYTYGGSYKGIGRYLTNVSGRAENLDVAWGYSFDGSVEVPSVTNAGTSEDPVASMELIVKWKMSTVLKANEGSASYSIRGDGAFQEL